jgi:hypothetical protein
MRRGVERMGIGERAMATFLDGRKEDGDWERQHF